MPYITLQQMIDRFGETEMIELTNLHNPDGIAINVANFDAAAVDAEAEINSYVGVVAQLPLATVPLVLGGKAADVVRYYLDTIDPRADVRQRYEDAIAWLKLLAAGEVDIGLNANDEGVGDDSRLRSSLKESNRRPIYERNTIDGKLWR